MSRISKLFYILLGLLMVDALLEMSFIAATVSFLHSRAGGSFLIQYRGDFYNLHGKPAHEIADQGHASNGAAGTALILVGFGGLLTFPFLRASSSGRLTTYARAMSIFWPIIAFLSVLVTFSCLVATMVVTARHAGQTIDQSVASRLNNRPYPNYVAYPLDSWTPENWFAAVLQLDLASPADRSTIHTKYNVIMGWRWNLIPLFLLGMAVFVVGFRELRRRKAAVVKESGMDTGMSEQKSVDAANWSDDGAYTNTAVEEEHGVPSPATPMLSSVTRKPVPKQNVGGVGERV